MTPTSTQPPGLPPFANINTTRDDEDSRRITYTLKIFNPNKKSKFSVQKFRRCEEFKSPEDLRSCIRSEFSNLVQNDDFDVGYYKGRGSAKIWIKDEEDIKCMYEQHSGSEVSLWCQGKHDDADTPTDTGNKRKASSQDPRPLKRQAIRDEVDELFAVLQEKHGSTYTAAQLRLWANMLQVGTHRDTDNPPKVPMFGLKTPKKTGGALNEALASVEEGFMRAIKSPAQPTPSLSGSTSPPNNSSRLPLDEIGVSPGKCASLRSQYIEQLKQLHQLLELTALSKEEYDEQKANILKKMQQL